MTIALYLLLYTAVALGSPSLLLSCSIITNNTSTAQHHHTYNNPKSINQLIQVLLPYAPQARIVFMAYATPVQQDASAASSNPSTPAVAGYAPRAGTVPQGA